MTVKSSTVTIVRWIARALAVALFLFWGAFFIEHLWEWFLRPLPQTPPLSIWFSQLLHLAILAGLIIGFKWESAGGLVVVFASVLFFADKAPIFIPITILPGILYLYCWYESRAIPARR